MPHVKELYDKYSKDGLVIIGVHVPRIDYEKEIPKIKDAVAKKEIKYPVVVDNCTKSGAIICATPGRAILSWIKTA